VEQRSATEVLIPTKYENLHATYTSRTTRLNPVWKQRLIPTVLILWDVLLALMIWDAAYVFQTIWGRGELSGGVAIVTMVPVVAVWIGSRALLGLYPGYGMDAVEGLRRHVYALLATLAVVAIFALGFQFGGLLSRLLLLSVFFGLLILAPPLQYFVRQGMKRVGLWGKPVVILSHRDAGTGITSLLKQNWELGYDPVAVFDFRLGGEDGSSEAMNHQKVLEGVVELAREKGVDTAIFAMPHTRREQLARLVGLASINFKHVVIIPNLSGVTNSAVAAKNFAGTFAVEIKYNLLDPWALRVKRVIDLLGTVIGGALILPLLATLALLVHLESGGPVFYRDRRMGRDGKLFSCLKFRTMVSDAETLLQRMLTEDAGMREEYFRYHKLRDDPRVTRVGRFLRKTSLDELPQLWNVLKGEMSLTGPRPYLPRESEEIGITQSEILRVPPGMTGPWQVAGRNETFFSDRVRMDAYYVRDWSVWLDIVLMARTVQTLMRGRGAY